MKSLAYLAIGAVFLLTAGAASAKQSDKVVAPGDGAVLMIVAIDHPSETVINMVSAAEIPNVSVERVEGGGHARSSLAPRLDGLKSTVEVSPLAAAAAQSYADSSREALDEMLSVMVAYGKDQKNMQKAMNVMVAVKSFEATTAAEYERASSVVGDSKTLAEPMNAFRADQEELAGRLMRAELSEWDGILAITARLEAALRSAAKPMVGT